MRQPAAAPLDHFCILFLREKDGGQCPQPGRAVASFETKLWASRTAVFTRLWAQFAARRSAGIANSVSDKTLGRVIPPR